MIDQYDIEIFVGGQKIELIREGYLNITNALEKYNWIRVRDAEGVMWAINTKKVDVARIKKHISKNIVNVWLDDNFF